MRGLHPPNVRFIKPYRYTVQPGDDVGVISGYFGMPVNKWPELCGANRHKRLSIDAPTGCKHRCFDNLESGEQLCVPAHWKNPVVGGLGSPLTRPSGSVGQSPVDMMVEFQKILQGVIPLLPVDKRPPTDMVDSLSAVIWSWWPHLQNSLPNPPPIPTNPTDIPSMIANGIFTVENWALLFDSANAFLKATGIGQGTAPQVQNIPWSDIPWNELATIWNKISKTAWQTLSSVMKSKSGGHTTQPVIVSPAPPPPLPPSGLPNFLDPAIWTSQSSSLSGVPFEKITWSETLVDALKDPRFFKCSTENPTRVEKLAGCGQCWQDGAKQFVDLLCSDAADPCDCDEAKEDPAKKDPAKEDPTPAAESKKGLSTAAMVGIGLTGALLLIAVGTSMSSKGK